MNPSGGLRWHWRAWRSQRQWQGTCEHMAQWLASVQPACDELLLLGPSAGWLLPSAFCKKMMRMSVGLMPASRSLAMRAFTTG